MKSNLLRISLALVAILGLSISMQATTASRTVTFTGAAVPNFDAGTYDGVVFAKSGDGVATATIPSLSADALSYLKMGGSSTYLSFSLSDPTEKIDSIKIVWLSAIADQVIPIVFGESISGSSPLTATNGGYTTTAAIATKGADNGLNEYVKFPEGAVVGSVYLARSISLNPATYLLNTVYPSLDARINSSNTTYPTVIGSSSTATVGEVDIYISAKTVTSVVKTASDLISVKLVDNKASISGLEGTAQVNVYNVAGQLIQSASVNNNEEISLGAKGVYILNIQTANQVVSKKLIVQ